MQGHVLVDAPDGTVVDIGPRGYAILSLFSQPVTLGNAIDRLEDGEGSSTDFVPALSVVNPKEKAAMRGSVYTGSASSPMRNVPRRGDAPGMRRRERRARAWPAQPHI